MSFHLRLYNDDNRKQRHSSWTLSGTFYVVSSLFYMFWRGLNTKQTLLKPYEVLSLQCTEAERGLSDNGAPFKYLLAHLHDLIYPEQLLALVSFFSRWHFPPKTFQVASRVQKYFIKLTKAGIPVPGRTPNLCMYTKKVFTKSSDCCCVNNAPF